MRVKRPPAVVRYCGTNPHMKRIQKRCDDLAQEKQDLTDQVELYETDLERTHRELDRQAAIIDGLLLAIGRSNPGRGTQ